MSGKTVTLLIVAAISVPILIALGVITLSSVEGQEESNAQEADRNLIEIIEVETVDRSKSKPESTEGGRRVSVLKRQEGAPVNLG